MRSHNEEQAVPATSGEGARASSGTETPVNGAPNQPGSSEPHGDSESNVSSSYDSSSYGYEDPYADRTASGTSAVAEAPPPPAKKAAPPPPPTPPTGGGGDDGDGDDGEEGGMLRMSFLEHLEELRSRILRAIAGLAVAYCACLYFAEELWKIVEAPAKTALTELGVNPPKLVQITPMEALSIVWLKLPLLAAVFIGSPWVGYQVWSFIAPGLYKRERRWAAPFVLCSAGLFILGGMFAYFVAFRFGLTFLLGIGRNIDIQPFVSVSEYFSLFVNVMLGLGVVFELPVVIFFLTLLRVASPRFLISHSRYAILAIVIIAAVVTPTPDVFNLMLFSVPMVALYFLGVFASYLLVLHREKRSFPWGVFLLAILLPIVLMAGGLSLAVLKYGYRMVPTWPFLVR